MQPPAAPPRQMGFMAQTLKHILLFSQPG